jgi:hypothetical protein
MHSVSTSIQEFYSIVCLDADVGSRSELDSVIPVCIFEQISDCLKYIRSQSNGKRIILIVRERMAQGIIPITQHLSQVFEIYIRCNDDGNNQQYKKFNKVCDS